MTDLEREERRAFWEGLTPAQRFEKQRDRDIEASYHPDYNARIVERAQERMARVDSFPPDVRAVIYERGLETVQEFWNHGVRKARSIEYLIAVTLAEDQADGNPRFGLNRAPSKPNPLTRAMVTVPLNPTSEMIAASMAEVSGGNERMTKSEKHRRRLRAAIHAAIKSSNDK